MDKPNRAGTYTAVGFVLGALAGAALAILFAPKSGKETREDLSDWLKEKGEQGKELLAKGQENLVHKKDQLGAALKAGREAYNAANDRKEKELVA